LTAKFQRKFLSTSRSNSASAIDWLVSISVILIQPELSACRGTAIWIDTSVFQ
jgi:hypothetical protein